MSKLKVLTTTWTHNSNSFILCIYFKSASTNPFAACSFNSKGGEEEAIFQVKFSLPLPLPLLSLLLKHPNDHGWRSLTQYRGTGHDFLFPEFRTSRGCPKNSLYRRRMDCTSLQNLWRTTTLRLLEILTSYFWHYYQFSMHLVLNTKKKSIALNRWPFLRLSQWFLMVQYWASICSASIPMNQSINQARLLTHIAVRRRSKTPP